MVKIPGEAKGPKVKVTSSPILDPPSAATVKAGLESVYGPGGPGAKAAQADGRVIDAMGHELGKMTGKSGLHRVVRAAATGIADAATDMVNFANPERALEAARDTKIPKGVKAPKT